VSLAKIQGVFIIHKKSDHRVALKLKSRSFPYVVK